MTIPDEVLKSVVFIGCPNKADGTYFYFGTGFFVGREKGDGTCDRVLLVTAKHVIDGIRATGATEVSIRVNLVDGTSRWDSMNINVWSIHPADKSIDVAVVERGIPAEEDHRVIPHTLFLTDEHIRALEVGLGDEVLITGLFRFYKGRDRNVPIVRIGNLACIGPDRVVAKHFGEMEAYLIEVRSLGGLSGAPVFLNLGRMRVIKGEITVTKGPTVYLLGLVHGHFESDAAAASKADVANTAEVEKLNVGIAVVVPIKSIAEVMSLWLKGALARMNG